MTIDLNSHDLNLPDWGPYSKRYGGVSHIPNVKDGLRFDLAVMPGYYRRQMIVPNEKWASGQHAWEASTDLSFYSYRYEIEWKDQVYCDVSFSALSESSRLIRCSFINNTSHAQDLMIHFVASMNFPPVRPYCDDSIKMVNVCLPKNGVWFDALDYSDLQYFNKRPSDNLVEDGMYRAEIRDHGLTNGSGIGCDFGKDIGDKVAYQLELDHSFTNANCVLRYRLNKNTQCRLKLTGLINQSIELGPKTDERDEFGYSICVINIGMLAARTHVLQLESQTETSIEIDGFAIVEQEKNQNHHNVTFTVKEWSFVPEIIEGQNEKSLILKYADTDTYYGIAWSHNNHWIRQLFNSELDSFMRQIVPDHMSSIKHGDDEGHFTDVFLRPICLQKNSTQETFAFVCSGDQQAVTNQLLSFFASNEKQLESEYEKIKERTISLKSIPAGDTYRFSQERMAATEMLNVVYPVYTRRQFIRHNTPGKWWDCLYTWDSGFIGLALLELDKQRAIENLNAYVTPEGDQHAAFIHHGSPVPTQMYLYHEIWNQTQDKKTLEKFYPSMRQYYQYLAGHISGSTMRELKSNLIRTWEYFFDSGGWDDYPAQLHTLDNEIESRVTCCAITAHVIRSAKILKFAAAELNIQQDISFYENDIAMFTQALQQHAWDEESGYFSYVLHDENGEPSGHLRHESGKNFNMGLDGVLPLFAGICTNEQETQLINKLEDPKRFWTNIGLSTVDQSAPYYREDGYWNGAVWMPQQWFIWKTALDMGNGELALKIATTALNLWKTEVENSYYCFEHFLIASERGTGWHQFSGLSSPVISWFNAYYKVGRLTVGMDIWIIEQAFKNDNREFDAILKSEKKRNMSVILNMNKDFEYVFSWNGKTLKSHLLNSGSYSINIDFVDNTGILTAKSI